MTNNSDLPPPGHINSPFLTKLPVEVRFMIYSEVFMGSRLEVRRHKYRQDPTNPRTEFVRICVPFNRQFSIVRTCKALYEESRNLYWCKTAVTCAYMSLQINLNAIPFYARPRIRVLEGVVTEDIFHPTNRMPLAQFLGHFPRLGYCQLHRQTVHMYCHQDDVPTEDFLARAGSDAIRNLASSLNADKPPVFLQRVYLWPQYDWDTVVWVYVNHTHGRMYIAAKGSISDEEGFKKVTGPVEEPQETKETQETVESNVEQDLIDFEKAIHAHEGLEPDDNKNVHETSMTDDDTKVNDLDVYEDKLEGLEDVIEDDNETSQVDV